MGIGEHQSEGEGGEGGREGKERLTRSGNTLDWMGPKPAINLTGDTGGRKFEGASVSCSARCLTEEMTCPVVRAVNFRLGQLCHVTRTRSFSFFIVIL